MPPAAISRSSTYFPKIWGNTAVKSSALPLALLVCGCGPDREPDQIRTIRAYYVNPAECGPSDADGEVNIQLDAVGDFEPSANTSEFPPDDVRGMDLAFPLSTRGVEAVAELAHPQLGKESRWAGVGLGDSDISFLLWPSRTSCPMWESSPAQNAFPLDAVGTSIGYLPERRLLFLSGSAFEAGDARSLLVDMGTGAVEEIASSESPIAFPTITAFGSDKLLVAGGIDPRGETTPGDRARVFDARTRSFETQDISLVHDRPGHAALVLANGDTLLVGGADGGDGARNSLELVSPKRPKSVAASDADVTELKYGRVSPTVFRLSDDSVFVAGGREGPNPDANAVSAIEWLSADASKLEASVGPEDGLRVARVHSFAPMPGGAVLAVGLCLVKVAGDECDTNADERQSRSIAWIFPDRSIYVFKTFLPHVSFTRLVPGSDGAPWLFAVTQNPAQAIWNRFLPWQSSPEIHFEIQENEPSSGPVPSPVTDLCDCMATSCETEIDICQAETECERVESCVEASNSCDIEACKLKYPSGVDSFAPVEACAKSRCGARPLAAPIPIEPGFFVWIEQTVDVLGKHPRIVGFRFDTRNAFSRQVAPLIADGPEHLGPGIPPFDMKPAINDDSQVRYDSTLRTLRLVGPEGKVTVADAKYADVDLEITSLANPRVGFGDQWFGQEVCTWPQGSGGDLLLVRRRGTSVTLERDSETVTCSVASGRHSIALRAPDDEGSVAIIERLTITRR